MHTSTSLLDTCIAFGTAALLLALAVLLPVVVAAQVTFATHWVIGAIAGAGVVAAMVFFARDFGKYPAHR